jgi:hypothetical protein
MGRDHGAARGREAPFVWRDFGLTFDKFEQRVAIGVRGPITTLVPSPSSNNRQLGASLRACDQRRRARVRPTSVRAITVIVVRIEVRRSVRPKSRKRSRLGAGKRRIKFKLAATR